MLSANAGRGAEPFGVRGAELHEGIGPGERARQGGSINFGLIDPLGSSCQQIPASRPQECFGRELAALEWILLGSHYPAPPTADGAGCYPIQAVPERLQQYLSAQFRQMALSGSLPSSAWIRCRSWLRRPGSAPRPTAAALPTPSKRRWLIQTGRRAAAAAMSPWGVMPSRSADIAPGSRLRTF